LEIWKNEDWRMLKKSMIFYLKSSILNFSNIHWK